MNGGAQNGSFLWVEDYEGEPHTSTQRKRKVRPRKLEFVGWGSKPLLEFLGSLSVDISKQISRYEAADIVNKYVTENNLLHPTKKKKVVCDDNLYFIFGKKTINRVKIYDLLGTHYAENQDNSDDDFFLSLEEEVTSDRVKPASTEKKIHQKKEVNQKPKSLFAAVTPENIKRVYLKKSLVLSLVQDFGSFESKVVGSFVRIKSDPNDYRQKNPYQLVQVTGNLLIKAQQFKLFFSFFIFPFRLSKRNQSFDQLLCHNLNSLDFST